MAVYTVGGAANKCPLRPTLSNCELCIAALVSILVGGMSDLVPLPISRNIVGVGLFLCCLASQANFVHGRVEAKVLSHVNFMPVLIRPVNNFLGQVIGNASEGKYNTANIPGSDVSKMSEFGDYPIFIKT